MRFQLVAPPTHISDATVITAMSLPGGRLWTLVSTATGQDVIVTPDGDHITYRPESDAVYTESLESFVQFIVDGV